MYLFKEYLARRLFEAEESIPPVPPGVDPAYWAFKSWRINWLNSPEGQAYTAKQQQQQKAPVARALGSGLRRIENNPLAPQMDTNQIENALAAFLKTTNSTQATLKELGKVNPTLYQAIQLKIRDRAIPVHENGGRATRQGRGIHFYRNLNGDVMFKQNTGNAF